MRVPFLPFQNLFFSAPDPLKRRMEESLVGLNRPAFTAASAAAGAALLAGPAWGVYRRNDAVMREMEQSGRINPLVADKIRELGRMRILSRAAMGALIGGILGGGVFDRYAGTKEKDDER